MERIASQHEQIQTMTIRNYRTDEKIGEADIDDDAYDAFLEKDNSGSGAVRAGDWLTNSQLDDLGIDSDLTIYCDNY